MLLNGISRSLPIVSPELVVQRVGLGGLLGHLPQRRIEIAEVVVDTGIGHPIDFHELALDDFLGVVSCTVHTLATHSLPEKSLSCGGKHLLEGGHFMLIVMHTRLLEEGLAFGVVGDITSALNDHTIHLVDCHSFIVNKKIRIS